MRKLPLALVLALGAAVLWPQVGYAEDDAPVSKEQEEINKQRRELDEQREKDAKRRLEDDKRAAEEKQKAVEEREKELDKLRPKRVPTPYVDPPDLAFGPYGSTALTMQSPRPRTRIYLAGDVSSWKHSESLGYPYAPQGWGLAGRAGGELAFGRLSFGGDVPWLYYTRARGETERLGFGDFTLFTKLHIFGAGKYDAKNYLTSMLRLTFPTHFPKEKWDAAKDALNANGYPATDDFYTKVEFAALVGHTLARRFSFGAQGGLVLFVGTGDLGGCPAAAGGSVDPACRAETHVGFDGHAHIGIRVLEALDLHVQAGGVAASGLNFANGGYVGGSLNLNLGSFRISAGATVPLNDQLQRLYRWIATLSLSWEHAQFKRPPQPGQPATP